MVALKLRPNDEFCRVFATAREGQNAAVIISWRLGLFGGKGGIQPAAAFTSSVQGVTAIEL